MIPNDLRTARLYLRPWREEDAVLLLPILEANTEHLRWIPTHVAAPAPLKVVMHRLSEFAADFRSGRCWRFGVFSPKEEEVFGEISLFPRSAEGRVQLEVADRLEIGYWLRADVTGRGYATEATSALLSVASNLPRMCRVEIHCDPRNEPSAAVPRRLGFHLLSPGSTSDVKPDGSGDMVWVYELVQPDV